MGNGFSDYKYYKAVFILKFEGKEGEKIPFVATAKLTKQAKKKKGGGGGPIFFVRREK